MKVWELIAKLGKYPANAEILFSTLAEKDGDYEFVEPEFDADGISEAEPFVNVYVVSNDFKL